MAKSEARVVAAAAELIKQARKHFPTYANYGGPIRTDEVCRFAALLDCEVHYFPFGSRTSGMALPPVLGVHPIFVDSLGSHADQMLTVRHELAHRLAGEITEPTFLTADDTMSHSERLADLFAIADLTGTWWMERIRGNRRPWRAVELEVVQAYRELTDGWSEQRLWDRARLRVQLFREHGI